MADTQILAPSVEGIPADLVIPASAEIQPKSVRATFDGTGAGGPFLPTLVLLSDADHEAWRIPAGDVVQPGDSAEVTWAPFLDGRAPGLPLWQDILFRVGLSYGTVRTDLGASYAYAMVQAPSAFKTVLVWLRVTSDTDGGPSIAPYKITGLPPALQIPDYTETQVIATGISNVSGPVTPDSARPSYIDTDGTVRPVRSGDPVVNANNYPAGAVIFSGFGVWPFHTNV